METGYAFTICLAGFSSLIVYRSSNCENVKFAALFMDGLGFAIYV